MGITCRYAELLLEAKSRGVCFDAVATIGRLQLYLYPAQLERLSRAHGISAKLNPSDYVFGHFADAFYRDFLGAKCVKAIDCSDYEDADIVHDFNREIGMQYHEQFDAAIDGGSLEHIFNVPAALASYMKMLKKGGSLFISTMANNHMGHGFYQFSPEFFYRVFQPANGFSMRRAALEIHPYPGAELTEGNKVFEVIDPESAASRVGLVHSQSALIMVHAVREEIKPIFESFPIQSDYAKTHEAHKAPHAGGGPPPKLSFIRQLRRIVWKALPLQIQNMYFGRRMKRLFSLRNRAFFRPQP